VPTGTAGSVSCYTENLEKGTQANGARISNQSSTTQCEPAAVIEVNDTAYVCLVDVFQNTETSGLVPDATGKSLELFLIVSSRNSKPYS